MPNFQNKLNQLVNSPQAKKLAGKAEALAKDPKTKAQVEKAKRKLAELRAGGRTGGTGGPKAA